MYIKYIPGVTRGRLDGDKPERCRLSLNRGLITIYRGKRKDRR